jgi:nucleoside transporter
MGAALFTRLGLMMFLEFFLWGAWWVSLGPYMKSDAIGWDAVVFWAYLGQPIGALLAPFFLGLVADRFFPSQWVLAGLHLLGAALLLFVPYFGETGDQALFITFIILHMLCYMPTIGLTNTVAFNAMSDPEKEFPPIRVWGTIGFIVSNLVVGVLFAALLAIKPEHTTWPFYLAASAAAVMGLYSLTLPHTPPPLKGERASVRKVLGIDAVKQLSSTPFWVFMIASMLICIPLAAYYTFGSLYGVDAGMGRELPLVGWEVATTGWFSTGQMMEVLFMLLMPLGFRRLGVKWMLLAGMGAWALRYLLFALAAPDQVFWMIWAGVLLHGICYDFFFVTGQVYVEKKATPNIRAQAQGFLVTMTLGVGMFIGMLVSGQLLFNNLVLPFEGQAQMDGYWTFWMIPAILSVVVMVGFALLFKDRQVEQEVAEESTDAAEPGAEGAEPAG